MSSLSKHRKKSAPQQDESDIPLELAQIVDKLPPQEKKTVIQYLAVSKNHSGPLPDGDTIRVYSEVIPNGGERLMVNVETQLTHRIDLEKTGLRRSYNQSSTGQWMGFFIAIVFGAIAWDLAKSGAEVAASIIGGLDIVGLVSVFIAGRSRGK